MCLSGGVRAQILADSPFTAPMAAFAESAGRRPARRVFSPMEIMNQATSADGTSHDGSRGAQVVIGLAIMLLGVSFLFERMDMWHVHLSRHFWPLFPLFFGIARLLDGPRVTRRGRQVRGGMWMIYIGIWGLMTEFHVFGLDYDTSWPLLIIAAGINMVWKSFECSRAGSIQGN
jgi:hypothetical protein